MILLLHHRKYKIDCKGITGSKQPLQTTCKTEDPTWKLLVEKNNKARWSSSNNTILFLNCIQRISFRSKVPFDGKIKPQNSEERKLEFLA